MIEADITFDGFMPARRQVTLTQNQLYELFEAMRRQFKTHVTYTTLHEDDSLFPEDKTVCDICKTHGVDFRSKRERVAFFDAILAVMDNPYK